mmetsp:Transcript_5523/g.16484  ORF Transcript_5523/g.16484 Transcript_5523/m.16484 type:complete len:373 (+) Transcript_5523:69-1187(+)
MNPTAVDGDRELAKYARTATVVLIWLITCGVVMAATFGRWGVAAKYSTEHSPSIQLDHMREMEDYARLASSLGGLHTVARNTVAFNHLSTRIPLCDSKRNKARSFIMIKTSYAGGTELFSQLARHPDVFWDSSPSPAEPLEEKSPASNASRAIAWTRQYFEKGIAQAKVPGVEMNIFSMLEAIDQWQDLLAEFDTKVIFNYRYDHLRRAVDKYIAQKAEEREPGLKESRHTARNGQPVVIDSFAAIHGLMMRSWNAQQVKRGVVRAVTNECALEVPYEDYLRYPKDVVSQTLDYLNLPKMKFDVQQKRGTNTNLCATVENFAEMCAAFRECAAWGWSLEDSENHCSCEKYEYTPMESEHALCSTAAHRGARS